MQNLVVLTGKAGAGKTTIAKMLVDDHGFHRVRFAGALKRMAAALGLNDDEIEGHLKEAPCEKLSMANFLKLAERVDAAFNAIGVNVEALEEETPISALNGHTALYATLSFTGVLSRVVYNDGTGEWASPRRLMQMIGTEWGREQIDKDLWIKLWRAEIAALDADANIVIDDCRFGNEEKACAEIGNATFIRVLRDSTVLKGAAQQAHASEGYVVGYHYFVENNSTPAEVGAKVVKLFRTEVLAKPALSHAV